MKRLSLGIMGGALTMLLVGCPIYPGTGNYRVCTANGCFDCPDKTYSGACIPWLCEVNADCADGFVCGAGNTCTAASLADAGAGTGSCTTPAECPSGSVCGQDNACHGGDCGGGVGCPTGYVCTVANGRAQCLSASGAGTDASSGGSDGSADASITDDASIPVSCNADSQCARGSKCINGQCVAQNQLCTDTTQCIATSESCVDGRCTPPCSLSAPCPTGYSCDFTHARNVCSINPNVCTGGTPCQGGAVCVEGHCVAPCATGDADAACPSGQVCVNGGCIPNELASFTCKNAGQSGPLADSCGAGSICLHGHCYIACDADAGSCITPSFCKQVAVTQGSFAVCAAAGDLGTDCDPAAGRYCDAGPCINGYCR